MTKGILDRENARHDARSIARPGCGYHRTRRLPVEYTTMRMRPLGRMRSRGVRGQCGRDGVALSPRDSGASASSFGRARRRPPLSVHGRPHTPVVRLDDDVIFTTFYTTVTRTGAIRVSARVTTSTRRSAVLIGNATLSDNLTRRRRIDGAIQVPAFRRARGGGRACSCGAPPDPLQWSLANDVSRRCSPGSTCLSIAAFERRYARDRRTSPRRQRTCSGDLVSALPARRLAPVRRTRFSRPRRRRPLTPRRSDGGPAQVARGGLARLGDAGRLLILDPVEHTHRYRDRRRFLQRSHSASAKSVGPSSIPRELLASKEDAASALLIDCLTATLGCGPDSRVSAAPGWSLSPKMVGVTI